MVSPGANIFLSVIKMKMNAWMLKNTKQLHLLLSVCVPGVIVFKEAESKKQHKQKLHHL